MCQMVSKSLVMEVNSGPATTSNPTLLERPYEGKEKVEKYISNFTKKYLVHSLVVNQVSFIWIKA